MELWLPYGRTEIPIRVPDDNFYRIIEPKKTVGTVDTAALIENAIDNPVGGLSLKDIAKPGCKAALIVDPIVPSAARLEAIRIVTSRLATLGVEKPRIFARNRLSEGNTSGIEGTQLDPSLNSFTEVGKTSLGTSVEINPELLSCEVKVVVGLAMPHFATGFSGGPDAILPSASSIRSIAKNRSLLLKRFPNPLNIGDNPVLSDSLEACKLVGTIYNVCFEPDGWGGISSALTGELESVFREAVSQFIEFRSSKIERKLDIVVVSAGRMLGFDLYHAVRVISNVLGSVRKGGTVILVAECSRGVGNPVFLDYARRFRERKELSAELRHRFKLGGHVNLFLQDLSEKCRIQVVSVLPEVFVQDTFGLKPSQTASEAVQKAIRVEGKESKILIVPRGDVTIPTMEISQAGA